MSTQTYPETDTARTSAEIEAGIRTTRERMDSTLDELGNRLSPRSLVNSAMDWWDKNSSGLPEGGGVKKTYRALTTHVKNNPVPSLLIGAGITWLLLQTDDEKDDTGGVKNKSLTDRSGNGYTTALPTGGTAGAREAEEPGILDKLKEKAHDAKEAVMDTVDKVKTRASDLADGAGEGGKMAHNLYESGHEALLKKGRRLETGYDTAVERAKEAVEEYPLAVGAAFVALGALLGVILPRTRREDRLMGEKSDALVDSVKEKGDELLEQGKSAAGELGEKVIGEAGGRGITAESAGEKLAELAGKTGEVIRKAVEEAAIAVKPAEETPQSPSGASNPASA